MPENIRETINDIVERYINKTEGEFDTRLRSWEWCRQAFLIKREMYYQETNEAEKSKIIDYLSLHLAFYLASWGMMRGGKFLSSREYKVHYNAVKVILEEPYEVLWDYSPENLEDAKTLLFDEENGLYFKIYNAYRQIDNAESGISDTLITKILLGTFGCMPGLDIYVRKALSKLSKTEPEFSQYHTSISVEKCFELLSDFAINHLDELQIVGITNFDYPPMKCVDLLLWDYGKNK